MIDVPDMWPHITVSSDEVPIVADAVERVADAIDHVFAAARTI